MTFFKNILHLIANPKDDLALLSVLQSEIYDFSEDELAQIRINTDATSFTKAFDEYNIAAVSYTHLTLPTILLV